MIDIHRGDCLEILPKLDNAACIFADPPDNIGLKYGDRADSMPEQDYYDWLHLCLRACLARAPIVWFSFNARHVIPMGVIATELGVPVKPCVQVYTFGQHRQSDLGNNHRPLWRFTRPDAKLYPDNVRIPSWRQVHGDKRADPRGRVPGDVFDMASPHYLPCRIGDWLSAALDDPAVCSEMKADISAWFETCPGDVFDFPRVTGNSKQRCDWHPTQIHEELIERCILLSTQPGDHVIDPFAGTGTTGRVCRRIDRRCSLIEIDEVYCAKMREAFTEVAPAADTAAASDPGPAAPLAVAM